MAHEFDETRPIRVSSIGEVNRDLLRQRTVKLPKTPRTPEPTEWGWGLEPSLLSLPKGANAVYRDDRPHDSIQVREMDDHYLIQLDHANPAEGQFLEHYRRDIGPSQKKKIAGSIAVGAVALALWKVASG